MKWTRRRGAGGPTHLREHLVLSITIHVVIVIVVISRLFVIVDNFWDPGCLVRGGALREAPPALLLGRRRLRLDASATYEPRISFRVEGDASSVRAPASRTINAQERLETPSIRQATDEGAPLPLPHLHQLLLRRPRLLPRQRVKDVLPLQRVAGLGVRGSYRPRLRVSAHHNVALTLPRAANEAVREGLDALDLEVTGA